MTTVVLAEPWPVWRTEINATLRPVPATVIAEADDGPDAISKVVAFKPDIAIIEPRVSHDDYGLTVMTEARAQGSDARVIFFAHTTESRPLYKTTIAGADGYLSTTAVAPDLCRAVKDVSEGRSRSRRT